MSEEDPLLSAVMNSLLDTYTPEGVGIWLNSRNRNLDGRPIDLIRSGNAEQVLAEADRLAGGPVAPSASVPSAHHPGEKPS